jgi:hypothetical protein
MEVSGQLHASAALPRENRPKYPLDRRLGTQFFNFQKLILKWNRPEGLIRNAEEEEEEEETNVAFEVLTPADMKTAVFRDITPRESKYGAKWEISVFVKAVPQMTVENDNELTTWSSVLEKLPVAQPHNNLRKYYGNRRLITEFTRGQSTGPYPEPDISSPHRATLSL